MRSTWGAHIDVATRPCRSPTVSPTSSIDLPFGKNEVDGKGPGFALGAVGGPDAADEGRMRTERGRFQCSKNDSRAPGLSNQGGSRARDSTIAGSSVSSVLRPAATQRPSLSLVRCLISANAHSLRIVTVRRVRTVSFPIAVDAVAIDLFDSRAPRRQEEACSVLISSYSAYRSRC